MCQTVNQLIFFNKFTDKISTRIPMCVKWLYSLLICSRQSVDKFIPARMIHDVPISNNIFILQNVERLKRPFRSFKHLSEIRNISFLGTSSLMSEGNSFCISEELEPLGEKGLIFAREVHCTFRGITFVPITRTAPIYISYCVYT